MQGIDSGLHNKYNEAGVKMDKKTKIPGSGGNYLVPYKERLGEESEVYFTRDLSPEGLKRIYDKVCGGILLKWIF